MRIVAVADTHRFEADLGTIPDGDVFIHAGDMLRGGRIEELVTVAAWIRGLPHKHKIVVAGNHDWCFVHDREQAIAMLGAAIYLEDEAVTIDRVSFYGSPWQPEFNDWAFNLPRGEALARKWAKIPDGVDVLITHGPPQGIGDRVQRPERVGCADLLARVRAVEPALHMFGHIHEAGGFWRDGATCFANVTTWECERGATVIDIEARTVDPVHIPPRRKET